MDRDIMFGGAYGVATVILMTLLLLPQALGYIEWTYNCTGGYLYVNATYYIDNVKHNISQPPVYCLHGCAYNSEECASPTSVPIEIYIAAGLSFCIIAFILAFLGTQFKESHFALQILFLASAVIYIMFGLFMIAGFSVYTQNQVYDLISLAGSVAMWIFILVLLYFFILLFTGGVQYMSKHKGRKKK